MAKFNKKSKPEVDDEDEAPVSKKKKVAVPENDDDEDDEDDAPPAKQKKKPVVDDDEDDAPPFDADDEDEDVPAKKKSKKSDDADEDDDEEVAPKKSKKAVVEDDDEDEDVPAKKSKKVSDEDDDEEDAPKKKAKADDDDEDEDDVPKKSKKADADDEDDKPKASLLKTGSAAKALAKSESAKAKLREERQGKLFQFFIHKTKLDKDFPVTFLDGALDDEDFFASNPLYYQHSEMIGGKLTHFRSPCEEEVDPLQEAGKEPVYVQAFTVIDHKGYTDKDGKKHKFLKRLFVAKAKTQKLLMKLAKKHGGLKGVTLEISRTGPKEPNVGNNFQFVGKQKISAYLEQLREAGVFGEVTNEKEREEKLRALVTPADYDNEINKYSAKDIKRMGLVQNVQTIDSKGPNANAKSLDDELDD